MSSLTVCPSHSVLGESCPVFVEYSVSIFGPGLEERQGQGSSWVLGGAAAGPEGQESKAVGEPGEAPGLRGSSSALVGGQRRRQGLLLPGRPPLRTHPRHCTSRTNPPVLLSPPLPSPSPLSRPCPSLKCSPQGIRDEDPGPGSLLCSSAGGALQLPLHHVKVCRRWLDSLCPVPV